MNMKIKKGDKVMMMAGKDRTKSGKVLSVDAKNGTVMVEGLNMFKKSMKPRKQGEKGQVVSMPQAIKISKINIICSSCGKPTRIGYKLESKSKTRICKKCNASI